MASVQTETSLDTSFVGNTVQVCLTLLVRLVWRGEATVLPS